MKCPACGNDDAYQGFSSVDCPNSSCRYFQGNPNSPPPSSTPSSGGISVPRAPAIPRIGTNLQPQLYPSGNTGIATVNLTVDILTKVPKRNSIHISFVAHGDPGIPNKQVEFFWSLPNLQPPRTCTLTTRQIYLVVGVDADGQTVYNTHWLCTSDGVQPNDPWDLMASIF